MMNRYLRTVLITGWSLALLAGCSSQYLASPQSGRSRLEQVLLSATIDEAVNDMTRGGLDPLAGKRVYVRVGDLDAEDLSTDFIRAAVEHRLLSLGIPTVESAEEADAVYIVRARVAGVDRSGSDGWGLIGGLFSLLIQYNKVWAGADLDGQAVDRESAAILLPSKSTGSAVNSYTDWSLLPMVFSSPFRLGAKSSSVNSPALR